MKIQIAKGQMNLKTQSQVAIFLKNCYFGELKKRYFDRVIGWHV